MRPAITTKLLQVDTKEKTRLSLKKFIISENN